MADSDTSKNRTGRIWARMSFDIEGIVGALASWLVGMLLGWLWAPLFWIGALTAVLILLATRRQSRISPEAANLVVAPCDGVVHSIVNTPAPTELRLGAGELVRLRISSSPFATNPVHAAVTGQINSLIIEEPDPSVVLASEPDTPGLSVAHISLESRGEQVGCRMATGGFGPRLEMLAEPEDAVRAGRVIGKRRLGGWCDLYLPAGSRLLVREGQTLIGAETVICRLKRDGAVSDDAEEPGESVDEPDVLPVPSEQELDGDNGSSDAEPEAPDAEPEEPEEPDEAAARLFKRLKEEAERGG